MKRVLELADRLEAMRWLANLTPADLARFPSALLLQSGEKLMAEYDRRNPYALFHWQSGNGFTDGVAVRLNDPRYEDEWLDAIDVYLGARLVGEYAYENPITERDINRTGGWEDIELCNVNLLDLPDFPDVSDPQAYLEEHIGSVPSDKKRRVSTS